MQEFDSRGIIRGIVSGGIDCFLQLLPKSGDFRHVYINRFVFDKKGLLESIIPTEYDHSPQDGRSKWLALLDFCNKENVRPDEVVFVGDSINDKEIAERSHFSIGFTGSSGGQLNEMVDRSIHKDNLWPVIQYIDEHEENIRDYNSLLWQRQIVNDDAKIPGSNNEQQFGSQ